MFGGHCWKMLGTRLLFELLGPPEFKLVGLGRLLVILDRTEMVVIEFITT